MNKIIITIFYISVCLASGNAQQLNIYDLQNAVIAQSIDRIDSILRLKGYSLTGIPKEGDNHKRYTFTKSMAVGKLAVISVNKNEDEKGTNRVFSFFDNEVKFYELKDECQKLREIQKVDEYTDSTGQFVRRYCDRFFVYTFQMGNDEKMNSIMYNVFIQYHSHPCRIRNSDQK